MPSRDQIHQAVLNTLAYAQVFRAPVPASRLREWLILSENVSQDAVSAVVSQLLRQGKIRSVAWVSDQAATRRKWRQVREAVRFLRQFPSISSIWVTGSLAVGNIQEDEDVDFMIITRSGTLWSTRLLLLLVDWPLHRVRRRRDDGKSVENKWCCNLWLEEESLELQTNQRSLYTAREIVQAVPVYQAGEGDAARFILANSWVQNWYGPGWRIALDRARKLPAQRQLVVWLLVKWVFFFLNAFAFQWQQRYMYRHRQQERVSRAWAFFHPVPRAQAVEQQYEKIRKSLS